MKIASSYKLISFLIVLITLLTSCVSQRNVEYLQDKADRTIEFNESAVDEYKLKPNDELFIQISSLDEASANIFSTNSTQNSMSIGGMQPYGASLSAYLIDKQGFLLLPLIGNILVKDKTTSEVRSILTDSLSSILNQPIVTVKLVNRYISVLGEVRNPGHFAYSQEKLTLFNAIALAGDITEFGNRKEVILTRNEDGKNIRVVVDLTKSKIIASEYYYLRPNDLLYIRPLKKKFWGMREFPFSIILSSISTAILIYTVVK